MCVWGVGMVIRLNSKIFVMGVKKSEIDKVGITSDMYLQEGGTVLREKGKRVMLVRFRECRAPPLNGEWWLGQRSMYSGGILGGTSTKRRLNGKGRPQS